MQFRAHGPLGQIYLVGCVIGLQSLVACSAQGDRFSLNVLSQAQSVPLGQALIVPPPGGPAVIGVTQTAYENGLEQNVLLATNSAVPGQNEFTVRALKDEPADNQTVVLGEERLQPERIGEELEERFPGVDMQVSLAYVQNKYGPFGFAIGQPRPGEQCLYAWQRIERGERPILSYEGGSVSVRLRLCETGRTPTELLRTAYGYTFVGYSRAVGWNPLGEPPAPSPSSRRDEHADLSGAPARHLRRRAPAARRTRGTCAGRAAGAPDRTVAGANGDRGAARERATAGLSHGPGASPGARAGEIRIAKRARRDEQNDRHRHLGSHRHRR